jgi:glycosyltransferase involved in cell wall biosynthesis
MRIAYFTDTPRIGGAERYLADVVVGALGAGHEVTVLAPQEALLEFIHAHAPGTRLLRAGRGDYHLAPTIPRRVVALGRSGLELSAALTRAGADLLHVNNGGYPGSDLCRVAPLAASFAGVPRRLLTVHSAPLARELSQPQLQAVVDWILWHSVEAVLGGTAVVGDGLRVRRGMPPALFRHVPYGVRKPARPERLAQDLRRRLAPGGELLVGMISATADTEKGHGVFLDALAASNGAVRAVIVGAGDDDFLVERIKELELTQRVAVEGWVPDVDPYLHAIDALVVPSTAYESLPLVALEAMAAGKPVFASRLSGIPEAVRDGETGRLFSAGAAPELAQLLDQAGRDRSSLSDMGKAAREQWAERYSLEVMVASVLALYEQPGHPEHREPLIGAD